MKNKYTITIIGAGAVGSAVARAARRKRIHVSGIYSAGGRSAIVLGRKVGAVEKGRLSQGAQYDGLVIIAVPDSRIAAVSREISRSTGSLRRAVFLHTSGALESSELNVLKNNGASIGSLHPMQTFPSRSKSSVRDIWWSIEGDARAVREGKRFVKMLDGNIFVIPKKAKVLYHTAGVFASNYLVTLMSIVEELAHEIKIPRNDIWKIYLPIVQMTLENVRKTSPARALTGPIARGDVKTVTKHIKALSTKKLNHLLSVYSALGLETTRLAKKKKYAR